MTRDQFVEQWLAPIGFALIFVGYFAVWLPNRAAGLAMMGLEIGEWVKFLPGMRWHPETNPNPLVDRNWFYLPPIMLSAGLLLWSQRWERSWLQRLVQLLAVAAATLALPAINDMLDHPRESLLRMSWVLLCGMLFLRVFFLRANFGRIAALLLLLAGLIGAILPTWAYFSMIPIVSDYTRETPTVGPGVWMNLAGHGALALVGLYSLLVSASNNRK